MVAFRSLRLWRFHGQADGRRITAASSVFTLIVAADQNFTFSGVVRLADNAFVFHPLHDRSSTSVADLQAALNVAGGGLAVANHDLHGLLIEVAALARAHGGLVEQRVVGILAFLLGGDGFEILRHALRLEMADNLLN